MLESYEVRGLVGYKFRDFYGEECSLEKSWLERADAVWFGLNDPTPIALGSGLQSGRMHLTREQVAALLPLLQHFARTGELPGGAHNGDALAGEPCELEDRSQFSGFTGVYDRHGQRIFVGDIVRNIRGPIVYEFEVTFTEGIYGHRHDTPPTEWQQVDSLYELRSREFLEVVSAANEGEKHG